MPRQDPQFRPDPSRAIHITEPLSESLLTRISEQLLQLRSAAGEPITVFINSPGGSIRILDIIDGLLHSRDPDGRTARIITVVLGDANSAAATLLALGDYAIAYGHSRMHFHGSRLAAVEDLTAEAASDRAGWLSSMNRSIAMRLAKVVLRRLVLRYVRLQPEIPEAGQRPGLNRANPIALFADCLKQRVSGAGENLLDCAIRHMGRIAKISNTFRKAGVKDTDSRLKADAKVFRAILNLEIQEHGKHDWCLDEVGIQEVVADYFLLRDYIFGEHVAHLAVAMDRYGPSFLTEEQFTEFAAKQATDPEEAKRWLRPLIESEVREFWYFTVCLCRYMQQGENSLGATDAYWLGVVDEVLGTELVGARHLMESDP